MSEGLRRYDVTLESEMQRPLDFTLWARLKPVDRLFKARITNIVSLTEKEKLFHLYILDRDDRERFRFLPGQFVMVEVPGYGEIPVSISDSPSSQGIIELCIREVGLVTGVLHRAKPGAVVGLRGPFGSHFPLEEMKGHDLLLVAGGLGVAPLRAPLLSVIENRAEYRGVHLLYGAKDPSQLLFRYQYEMWRSINNIDMQVIVEHPGDEGWDGPTGFVTALLDELPVTMSEAFAIVCGPPVMFKFVCNQLARMGMPMRHMFVSLERRMHCGMGKCCRCSVGSTYTCLDGPVFDYWTVMNLKEAI